MVPSWRWKTEHFSSLTDISMNSPGCLLEVASFILPWDLLSVNCMSACPLHCVVNDFPTPVFQKEVIYFQMMGSISYLACQVNRVTVMVTLPAHLLWLQISWLPIEAVRQRWNKRSSGCAVGRAAILFKKQGSFMGLLLALSKSICHGIMLQAFPSSQISVYSIPVPDAEQAAGQVRATS